MPSPVQRAARPLETAVWEERIRAHDHRVVVSLLAIGLRPERAREIAQAAWVRLMEQEAAGALTALDLPGLAIRQARFLALDAARRDHAERRRIAAALQLESDEVEGDAVERRLAGRQELRRVAEVLSTCPPNARRLFHLLYARGASPAEAAADLGLSLQRTRQILCETRKKIRAALEEDA